MSNVPVPVDRYHRRRAAGEVSRAETRRRLLAAADALFREQGYSATTVAAIAKQAGVSLQTLYLAWGSKRALLRAATDAAASTDNTATAGVADQDPVRPDQWRTTVLAELAAAAPGEAGRADERTAPAYLAAVSRFFVKLAGRTAPYWRMHRQAAGADPDIATDWQAVIRDRRQTFAQVAASVPKVGLRPQLTERDLTDTLWAVASPEVYDLLTLHGGYTPEAFQIWLERTLTAALCCDSSPAER